MLFRSLAARLTAHHGGAKIYLKREELNHTGSHKVNNVLGQIMRVEIADGVEAALRSLARLSYEVPPRILITGSLYLAGEALRENGTLPQ